MSNTFDGVLREFPWVGIDCFNTLASIFLLTHCHADHLTGISNKSFSGLIYCSEDTKRLLELDLRLKQCMNLIKSVPFNTRTRLGTHEDASRHLYITLIEAYHCFGASMFLLEEIENLGIDDNGEDAAFSHDRVLRTVLCTGDLRAENWWCESLNTSPALFPYINGGKLIDCIYFDSTFAYRQEPYIEIPPNNLGIHTAVSMLKKYPKNDPDIQFEFCDTTLGFEEAWAFILGYFGGCLKIENTHLMRKIQLVAKHNTANGSILRRAIKKPDIPSKYPVFYGGAPLDTGKIKVKIKQCINFNIRDFTGICCPISLESIPSLGELKLVRTTSLGHKVYDFLGRQWILPVGGKEILPLDVKLLFSRHSSYSEIRDFLTLFQPKQVFPCCYSERFWLCGFSMKRIFGSLCSSKKFHYDDMMTSKYGSPTQDVLSRPVVTINRWNVEDCDKEQRFFEDLLKDQVAELSPTTEGGPNLLNLRKVVRVPFLKKDRSAEDFAFLKKRNKDFSLMKIVEGRRNENFEKFVRNQQMLYYKKHNLPQYARDYNAATYTREFDSALGGTSDYDTDSCHSSFDLLEGHTIRKKQGSVCEKSFVAESQQGLFWKVHKMPSKSKTLRRSSFLQSSFESFEESVGPQKPTEVRSNDILLAAEKRIDRARIERLSVNLAKSPMAWLDLDLKCKS